MQLLYCVSFRLFLSPSRLSRARGTSTAYRCGVLCLCSKAKQAPIARLQPLLVLDASHHSCCRRRPRVCTLTIRLFVTDTASPTLLERCSLHPALPLRPKVSAGCCFCLCLCLVPYLRPRVSSCPASSIQEPEDQ